MFSVTAVCSLNNLPSLGLFQGHTGEGEWKALQGLQFVLAWPRTASNRQEWAAGGNGQARIKLEYRINKDFFFSTKEIKYTQANPTHTMYHSKKWPKHPPGMGLPAHFRGREGGTIMSKTQFPTGTQEVLQQPQPRLLL